VPTFVPTSVQIRSHPRAHPLVAADGRDRVIALDTLQHAAEDLDLAHRGGVQKIWVFGSVGPGRSHRQQRRRPSGRLRDKDDPSPTIRRRLCRDRARTTRERPVDAVNLPVTASREMLRRTKAMYLCVILFGRFNTTSI
jgi:hypothetical protein